jgi:hypothetical protein
LGIRAGCKSSLQGPETTKARALKCPPRPRVAADDVGDVVAFVLVGLEEGIVLGAVVGDLDISSSPLDAGAPLLAASGSASASSSGTSSTSAASGASATSGASGATGARAAAEAATACSARPDGTPSRISGRSIGSLLRS